MRRPSARGAARSRRARRRRRAAPHASVSVEGRRLGARAATSSATSRSPIGSPPPRSRACRPRSRARPASSPTSSTSARHASRSACAPSARTAPRPTRQVGLAPAPSGTSQSEHLAGLRDRLGERRVLLQLAADEREHRRRAPAPRYAGDRLRVGAPSSARRRSTMTSRPPTAKRPSALQAATASSPLASAALEVLDRVLAEAVREPPQRAVDLRPVGAGEQVDGLQRRPSAPSIGGGRGRRRAAAPSSARRRP